MIPLRDTIRGKRTPVAVIGLIAVNLTVFLYQWLLSDYGFAQFIYRYGFIPARLTGWGFREETAGLQLVYPLVTSMFLHGGWFHLISNMWALWLFGDNVEDRMGHGRFTVYYLLCGLAAGVTHYVFGPLSPVPVVGASGAIAGIMAAYMVLYPSSRILTLIPVIIIPLFLEIPALLYISIWFISQLFSATFDVLGGGGAGGGIAWWAHIGGFVAGLLLYRRFLLRVQMRYTVFPYDRYYH